MAVLNLNYYKGNDEYSDGDIENLMLKISQNPEDWKEYTDTQNKFTLAYHFSQIRENILNWYCFKENATILEIGSGCGALTGLLCERGKQVVSVELSKRRAQINYNRHNEYDNLEIIVGNLEDIALEQKFDYIVVNGVFEYAISFIKSQTPYDDFLHILKKFLSDQGRILIAIENRLGIKYFLGAPEDHTNELFLGLNNYVNNDSVRTFSKEELSQLLIRNGLRQLKYYYPFPDYKWPTEIYSDETINELGYGSRSINMEKNTVHLFDEANICRSLCNEKVMSQFANSFLVEAAVDDTIDHNNINYVKLSNDRKSNYQIATIIESGSSTVRKLALKRASMPHIQKMWYFSKVKHKNKFSLEKINYCHENEIQYDFICCENLDDKLTDLILCRDLKAIVELFTEYNNIFFGNAVSVEPTEIYTPEFVEVFGEDAISQAFNCIKPANIDLILKNVFCKEDQYIVIDYEWIFDFNVPVQFILWRTINEVYETHKDLNDLVNRDFLMKLFKIDSILDTMFRNWANHFARDYVGSNFFEYFSNSPKIISLNEIFKEIRKNEIDESSLYIDEGSGFSENLKATSNIYFTGNRFQVRFDVNKFKNITNIRWDPLEVACRCSIEKCYSNQGELELYALNKQDTEGDIDIFLSCDPNYHINAQEELEWIIIEGEIQRFTLSDLSERLCQSQSLLDEKARLIADYAQSQDAMQKELENLRSVSTELHQCNQHLEMENQSLRERKHAVEEEKITLSEQIQEAKRCIDENSEKINQLEADHNVTLKLVKDLKSIIKEQNVLFDNLKRDNEHLTKTLMIEMKVNEVLKRRMQ